MLTSQTRTQMLHFITRASHTTASANKTAQTRGIPAWEHLQFKIKNRREKRKEERNLLTKLQDHWDSRFAQDHVWFNTHQQPETSEQQMQKYIQRDATLIQRFNNYKEVSLIYTACKMAIHLNSNNTRGPD